MNLDVKNIKIPNKMFVITCEDLLDAQRPIFHLRFQYSSFIDTDRSLFSTQRKVEIYSSLYQRVIPAPDALIMTLL